MRRESVEPRRFLPSGHQTVVDLVQGLEWQHVGNAFLGAHGQARDYARDLDLESGGWRLPEVLELRSLVVRGRVPVIDSVFDCRPSGYWTRTPGPESSGFWVVNFMSRGTEYVQSVSVAQYARCVRSWVPDRYGLDPWVQQYLRVHGEYEKHVDTIRTARARRDAVVSELSALAAQLGQDGLSEVGRRLNSM